MGIPFSVDHDVKGGQALVPDKVGGGTIGRLLKAKGKSVQALGHAPGPGVVGVDDDASPGRHQLGKPAEGVLDVLQDSTLRITATVGEKERKELQYSQDSAMMVSPLPTRWPAPNMGRVPPIMTVGSR